LIDDPLLQRAVVHYRPCPAREKTGTMQKTTTTKKKKKKKKLVKKKLVIPSASGLDGRA
jgi:hypothetical protein